MRLRILELPPEVDNGRTTTPFVIVLDDVTAVNAEFAQQVKEQLGAKGVLVFPERIELGGDQATPQVEGEQPVIDHELIEKKLNGNTDALDWAVAFVATVQERPWIATDEGTMIGWFANAIEAGGTLARANLLVNP